MPHGWMVWDIHPAHQWWANSCFFAPFFEILKESIFVNKNWVLLDVVNLQPISWHYPPKVSIQYNISICIMYKNLFFGFSTPKPLHQQTSRIFHSEYLWSAEMWSWDMNRQFLQLVGFAEALPWVFFVPVIRCRGGGSGEDSRCLGGNEKRRSMYSKYLLITYVI